MIFVEKNMRIKKDIAHRIYSLYKNQLGNGKALKSYDSIINKLFMLRRYIT